MHNLRLSPGSYRTARVIVAVSGRYLAGGPKKSTRKEGQQVSKADVVGDCPQARWSTCHFEVVLACFVLVRPHCLSL